MTEIFITFFKIGLFTIGGGYAMIPLITDEMTRLGLLTREEILNLIAVAEGTPGPFAVNIATFVGYKSFGFLGGIIATLGVVLPSVLIIIIVSMLYEKIRKTKVLDFLMTGLRPSAIALLFSAVIALALPHITPVFDLLGVVCLIIMIGITQIKKIPPIGILGISALLGIVVKFIF